MGRLGFAKGTHMSAGVWRIENDVADAGDEQTGPLSVPQQWALHSRQHYLCPAKRSLTVSALLQDTHHYLPSIKLLPHAI